MKGKRKEIPHPDQPKLFSFEVSPTYLLGVDGKALGTAQSRRKKVSEQVSREKAGVQSKPHSKEQRPTRRVKLTQSFFNNAEPMWTWAQEVKGVPVVSSRRAPEQIALERKLGEQRTYRCGIRYFVEHPESFVNVSVDRSLPGSALTGIISMQTKDAIDMKPDIAKRALKAFPESIRKLKRP